MEIKYYAWISSKGERKEIKNGAIYCGLVGNLPDVIKKNVNGFDKSEKRQYCIVKELK